MLDRDQLQLATFHDSSGVQRGSVQTKLVDTAPTLSSTQNHWVTDQTQDNGLFWPNVFYYCWVITKLEYGYFDTQYNNKLKSVQVVKQLE